MDSAANHPKRPSHTSAGSHVCSNFDSDQKLWWKPYQIGKPNAKSKTKTREAKQKLVIKHSNHDMQCTADKRWVF